MKKVILFLIPFIFLIKQSFSECCLKFMESKCAECPKGMHLYKYNCIYDVPNCQNYSDGFECSSCKIGFKFINQNKTCIPTQADFTNIPTTGFQELSVQNLWSDQLQSFIGLTDTLTKGEFGSLSLHRGYGVVVQNQKFYRLIFATTTGFLQAAYQVKDPAQKSLLLQTRDFNIQPQEEFINIDSDPQMPQARQFIKNNYQKYAGLQIIDAWKSQNKIKKKYLYRIFITDPNTGIQQVFVQLNQLGEPVIEELDINTADKDLKTLIYGLIIKSGFEPYLRKTSVTKVQRKTTKNMPTQYNITFGHAGVFLTNKSQAESYFVFEADDFTNVYDKILQIKVKESYMYRKQVPESNIIWISDQPLNQAITEVMYEEYVNASSIKNSPAFPTIQQLLLRQYGDKIGRSSIFKSGYAQNKTHNIYEIIYKENLKQPNYYFFCLSIQKQLNRLSILNFYETPQSKYKVTKVNDLNREKVLSKLAPIQTSLVYSILPTEQLFRPQSLLVQVTLIQYDVIDINTNKTVNATGYWFRYMNNPTKDNVNEYVQYRYQLTGTMGILGHYFAKYELFVEDSAQNILTKSKIQTFQWMHRAFLNDIGEQPVKSTIVKTFRSMQRYQVFKVVYDLQLERRRTGSATYQFDITGNTTFLKAIAVTQIQNKIANDPNILKKKQILQNQTITRLLQFISIQIPDVQNKTFVYIKRTNADLVPRNIIRQQYLDEAGDIMQMLYTNMTSWSGFSVYAGLGSDRFQVVVLGTQNIAFVQKDVIDYVKYYLEIDTNTKNSTNSTNRTNATNNTIDNTTNTTEQIIIPEPPVLNQIQQAFAQYPQLIKRYEGIANKSVAENKNNIIILLDVNKIVVKQKSGQMYTISKQNPIPLITTNPLREKSQGQPKIAEATLKNAISDMLGVPADNLQNVKVVDKLSVLDTIDTYYVDFVQVAPNSTSTNTNTNTNTSNSSKPNSATIVPSSPILYGDSPSTQIMADTPSPSKPILGAPAKTKLGKSSQPLSSLNIVSRIILQTLNNNTKTNTNNTNTTNTNTTNTSSVTQSLTSSLSPTTALTRPILSRTLNTNITTTTNTNINTNINTINNTINTTNNRNTSTAQPLGYSMFDLFSVMNAVGTRVMTNDRPSNPSINISNIPPINTSINSSINTVTLPNISNTMNSSGYNIRSLSSTNLPFIPLHYYYSGTNLDVYAKLKAGLLDAPKNDTIAFINKVFGNKAETLSQRRIIQSNLTYAQVQHPSYGRMNIFYNSDQSKIYQIIFADEGFYISGSSAQDFYVYPDIKGVENFTSMEVCRIFKVVQYTEKISNPNVERPVNVSASDLVLWKIKRMGKIQEVQFYYELQSNILRVKVMVLRKSSQQFQITITEFEAIDNNLETLRTSNKNYKQQQIDQIVSKNQFKEAEKTLKQQYGFYLIDGKVIDIIYRQAGGDVLFDVRYDTPYGQLEGKLGYTISTKKGRVISLTTPKARNLSILQKGCKSMSSTGQGCLQCNPEYYRHRDANCYPKIEGCGLQSGEVCLVCEPGFQLFQSKCLT